MITVKGPPFVLLELRQLEYFPLFPKLENERDFCREQALFFWTLLSLPLDLEGLDTVRAKCTNHLRVTPISTKLCAPISPTLAPREFAKFTAQNLTLHFSITQPLSQSGDKDSVRWLPQTSNTRKNAFRFAQREVRDLSKWLSNT